jgi:peptidoglycan/xylan/chitin deacetylase (PgdA/CDA1 family)
MSGRREYFLCSTNIQSGATWFIPGHTIETYPVIVEENDRSGHEIRHHKYLHEVPSLLTLEQEIKIMKRGIACIKEIMGRYRLGIGLLLGAYLLEPKHVELAFWTKGSSKIVA